MKRLCGILMQVMTYCWSLGSSDVSAPVAELWRWDHRRRGRSWTQPLLSMQVYCACTCLQSPLCGRLLKSTDQALYLLTFSAVAMAQQHLPGDTVFHVDSDMTDEGPGMDPSGDMRHDAGSPGDSVHAPAKLTDKRKRYRFAAQNAAYALNDNCGALGHRVWLFLYFCCVVFESWFVLALHSGMSCYGADALARSYQFAR